MGNKQFTAVIHGLVQGVLFRENTKNKGFELGLTGWVKNRPDGTVQCLAQGEAEQLEQLVEFWRSNPGVSQVNRIDLVWDESPGKLDYFEIV